MRPSPASSGFGFPDQEISMPASKAGGPSADLPTRAPGRSFAFADPERQREVEDDAPQAAPHKAPGEGQHPQRSAALRARSPVARSASALPETDHEGGSSRHSR
jgi:hypothetical protein